MNLLISYNCLIKWYKNSNFPFHFVWKGTIYEKIGCIFDAEISRDVFLKKVVIQLKFCTFIIIRYKSVHYWGCYGKICSVRKCCCIPTGDVLALTSHYNRCAKKKPENIVIFGWLANIHHAFQKMHVSHFQLSFLEKHSFSFIFEKTQKTCWDVFAKTNTVFFSWTCKKINKYPFGLHGLYVCALRRELFPVTKNPEPVFVNV